MAYRIQAAGIVWRLQNKEGFEVSTKEIDDLNQVIHHEVTVRAFYVCDEADLCPSITFSGKLGNDPINLDVGKVVAKLVTEFEGAPFTNVRPMKADEVAEYLAKEREEEREKEDGCFIKL